MTPPSCGSDKGSVCANGGLPNFMLEESYIGVKEKVVVEAAGSGSGVEANEIFEGGCDSIPCTCEKDTGMRDFPKTILYYNIRYNTKPCHFIT